MADSVELDPGSGGSLVYVDDITVATSTLVAQRVKLLLGADGVDDGNVHSSNPLPVDLRNISSVATQATLAEVTTFAASTNALLSSQTLRLNDISTFTNSTNAILAQSLSSSTVRITIAVDDVGIGGGTQYVEDTTSTTPTGTIFLWKSAVSTLKAVSSSFPLPVSSAPLTANIGTIGTIATQATLAEISTFSASTVSLLSSNKLRLENISTFTNSTNTLLLAVSSNTASSNALVSTQSVTLGNISTFTASTNALVSTGNLRLTDISSNTASSNALLSTVAARLAPVPTGIYVQPVAVSSNGLSTFMTLDADETEEQISATACTVYGVWAANTGTAGAYIKLFNGTSSAIMVSTATPLIVMPIPGSSTQSLVGANYNVGGMGITFSTACCVAAVTGAANFNTTAPAESTIICNIFYKA